MISFQQGEISWQKHAEVDVNSVIGASLPSIASGVSVEQVSNTHNQPSTCRRLIVSPRSKKVSLSDLRQREVLPILLQVLSSEKNLNYDEEQLSKIDNSRKFEKLQYVDFISFAIQTQVALLCVKMRVVKLLALKKLNAPGTQTRDVRHSIRKTIVAFFNSGRCYFFQLDKINSGEKNVSLVDSLKYQNALARLKSSKEVLQKYKDSYLEALRQNSFLSKNIEDYIRNSLIEQKYTYTIHKHEVFASISFAELRESIKKQFQAGNEVEIFCKPAFIPEQLLFKEKRHPIPSNFWELLDSKMELNEYTAQFHKFLLTNWENEADYKARFTLELIQAAKVKDTEAECALLLKKCLEKNMAYNAALLVKHALNIKEKQAALEKTVISETSRDSVIRIKNNQVFSLQRLKNIIQNDYKRNYSDYHVKKANLPMLSAIESFALKGTLTKARQSAGRGLLRAKEKCKLALNENLEYLNQVFHLLREKPNFDENQLIHIVKFYLAKENHDRHATSADTYDGRQIEYRHDLSQMSGEPSAKRLAKSTHKKKTVSFKEVDVIQDNASEITSFTTFNDTDSQNDQSTIKPPHLHFSQSVSPQNTRPSLQINVINFEAAAEFSKSNMLISPSPSPSTNELAQTDNWLETEDFDFEIDMDINAEDIDLSLFNEFE